MTQTKQPQFSLLTLVLCGWLALLIMPSPAFSANCQNTYGFSEFANGKAWINLQIKDKQIYLIDSYRRTEADNATDRYAVCLSNRLIVQLKEKQSIESVKRSLHALLPDHLNINNGQAFFHFQHLFELVDSNLWLIEVTRPDLVYPSFIELLRKPYVETVQPDLLIKPRQMSAKSDKRWDLDNYKVEKALGIEELWQHTLGKQVTVAVIDSGLYPEHRDLVGADFHYYLIGQANGSHSHGLQVAGIIAAQHNNLDISGIAPR